MSQWVFCCFLFYFNHTAPTESYTLSLHDALPISSRVVPGSSVTMARSVPSSALKSEDLPALGRPAITRDRKSTRLNSSHANISYAVFCLKKKTRRLLCGTLCDADQALHQSLCPLC